MWPKHYRDYKEDEPNVKYQIEPGKGIIGCEMHDLNGWGNSLQLSSEDFSGPHFNDSIRASVKKKLEDTKR